MLTKLYSQRIFRQSKAHMSPYPPSPAATGNEPLSPRRRLQTACYTDTLTGRYAR